jgi:FG-GAP-like repeat
MSRANPLRRAAFVASLLTVAVSMPASAICGNGVVDPNEICVAAPTTIWATPTPVVAVAAADLNGDGRTDLASVTANRSGVTLATGAGFGPTATIIHAGVSFRDVAAGDFDGDGDLDLAYVDQPGNRILVRQNLGAGAFDAGAFVGVGVGPIRVLAARLNADARADLVVLNATADTVTVLFGVMGGPPVFGANYAVGDATDIALGDCDGSGLADVLYVNGFGTNALLRARRNNGAGGLLAPVVSSLPLFDPAVGFLNPLAIVSAPLNGDAFADVAVSATQSRLVPATSNAACSFTPGSFTTTWAWSNRLRAVRLDLGVASDIAAPHGVAGAFSVIFGNGAGGFAAGDAEIYQPAITGAYDLAFGNFNNDTFLDVVSATDIGLVLLRATP